MTNTLFATGPEKSAVISSCGLYRYTLRRTWGDGGRIVNWIMLNPSKADANIDDPTIRRCIDFSQAWHFDALVVTNLYAFRATDPRDLWAATDPLGPENAGHLIRAATLANLVICAWGAHGEANGRGTELLQDLRSLRVVPHCLTKTKSGQPGHPLFLPKGLKPVPF